MRVYAQPVHYKHDGGWADINTSLVQGSDGRWRQAADDQGTSFAAAANDPALITWTLDSGHQVSYGLQDAAPVAARVAASSVTYPSAAPNSDVVYNASANSIKETLELHSAAAPTTWVFPLSLTGLTPKLDAAGNVEFTDSTGKVDLTIPHGYMEDSAKVGPGEGAISTGVTYALTTLAGAPALEMKLDAAWLHDAHRVFPVKVDPTTSSSQANATTSTYVETPYDLNFSSNTELKTGTYDGGAHQATSYIEFPSIGSSGLANQYIEKVSLTVDAVDGSQCSTATEVDVRQIVDSWDPATVTMASQVPLGQKLGQDTFKESNQGTCTSGAVWIPFDLGDNSTAAGSKLVESWVHGGSNYGLALTSDITDTNAWKVFDSSTPESGSTPNAPYLSVTYSPYGADYSTPTSYIPPTESSTGSQSVTLTNLGSSAWTGGNMSLKARLYDANWNEQSTSATLTKVPGTVNPNGTVTMTGSIPAIGPGASYQLCWDLYVNGTTSLESTYGIPYENCTWVSAANIPPQIDSMQPLSNQVVNSLSPEIMATGHDPDSWPGTGLTYYFQVFDASGTLLTSSGWISTPTWKVNYGYLAWNASYSWRVEDSDSKNSGAWTNVATFTTQVPQPPVTSHLATPDDGSGHAFDPQVGNYATSATDASVAVAGPSLGVKRSYNSLDPRTTSLFGAGWSTAYDMQVQLDADNSGSVVVTNAGGQSERFGRNDFALTQTTSVGDVTGDGIDDVVAVDKTDGGLYLYRGPDYSAATRVGISRGRWSAVSLNGKTLDGWSSMTSLTGGDVDGDGIGDLIAVDPLNGIWEWSSASKTCPTGTFHSDSGSGNFPPNAPFSCPPVLIAGGGTDWTTMSNFAVTPPLSGDGLKDLVGVETTTGLLYAYPIQTDGSLGARVELGTGWNGVRDLVGGTFNGHGGIVGIAGSGNVVLYAGKGTGSLGTSVLSAAVNLATGWGSVRDLSAVAGIAGDSGSDLVAVDGTTGAQYLYHQAHGFSGATRSATGMGLYVSPAGSGEQLVAQSDGSWVLREKSGTSYTFAEPAYPARVGTLRLSKITDKEGRTQVLTYNSLYGTLAQVTDSASGRAVHFTWNAAETHVASVFTDPSSGTDQNTDLTWTYTYSSTSPDELDQVCAPPTGGNSQRPCTTYSYTTGSASGSHYPTTVLDSAPTAYWRLGDVQGADATDAVLANEGAQDATYSGVSLGASGGPLPGSPTVVASFNGTSSQLTLPNRLLATTYVSAGLWFKTTSAGVLLGYASSPLGSASRPAHAVNPLYVGTDGLLRGEFYSTVGSSSPITSSTTVTDGKWHFALLTAAGNTQTLYLDGNPVATQTAQITPLDMNYVSVGAGYTQATPWPDAPAAGTAGDNHFKGQIAEVAVYQHTLGAPAITAQWQAGSRPATELSAVTTPLGKSKLAVVYDAVNDRASQVTDANGGTYKLGKPTVSGSTQQYKGAVLASRPSGYWRLGDGAGEQAANEIYADRPAPDNGTYSNVTLGAASGPPTGSNSSAGFDGSTSALQLPTANAPQQAPAAVALWFNTTKPGVLLSYQSIPLGAAHTAADGWDPALYVGTDNKLHGGLFTGGTTMVSTATVTDGKWHFVVLDATTSSSQTLYLDGAAAAAPLTDATVPTGSQYVYVGAGTADGWPSAPTDPDGHFTGQIADVATFPHGLTAAQIANLNTAGTTTYTCTPSGACMIVNPQPVYDAAILDAQPSGYWQLADTTGNQAAEVLSSAALAQNQGTATNVGSDTGPWASGSTITDSFNGTDSNIALPGSLGVKAAPASVEVWFKTTSAGVLYANQTFPLGSSSNGTTDRWNPTLYVGSDGNLHGQFFTGTAAPATSSATVTDGKWHLADLVASGSTQQLYLDGEATGAPITGTIRYNGQGYTYLGAGHTTSWPSAPNDTDGHLNGSLADFATYSYALDANTIHGHYTAATVPDPDTGMDASSAYRAEVVQAGPSDYWRLDEGQGQKVQDELGTALPDPYAGTYSDVTLNTAGPSGNSDESGATFNGTSSAVQLPSTAAPVTGPASVELWFKTTKAGVLYSYQSGALGTTQTNWNPALYVGTDNKLHGLFLDTAGSTSDQLTSTGTVTDNKWHQAVLAATPTSETLFLDGAQVGTEAKGSLFFNGGAYAYLGAGATSSAWPAAPTVDATGTNYFTGSLAEFAYYPSTLDATTVAAHFQAMSSSANPTPVTTVKVTDPGNNTLSYSYDTDNGGRIIAKRDAYSNSTRYGYDTAGNLDTVTDADGHTTTTGHDTRGNPVSTTTCTNPSTCNTSYATYYLNPPNALDPRHDEVTSTSDARSTSATDTTYQTTYQYDSTGNLTSITRPDGTSSGRSYTFATTPATGGGTAPPGLLATTTDYKNNTTAYNYFSNGDLASTTSPSGQVTTYTYDNLGRTVSKTVNCADCTGSTTATTSYTLDGQGNVITETDPTVTDAVNGALQHTRRTTYAYDLDGQETSQTVIDLSGNDQSRIATWSYSSHDLVASSTDPAGRVTTYGYDGYGNTTSKTDPDGTKYTYIYSPMGQLQQTAIANYTGDPNHPVPSHWQVVDSRAYDPAGRLATDTDAMGRTTHTYYYDDNTVAEIDLDGYHNADGTLRNVVEQTDTYDAVGDVTDKTTGGGKTTVTSTYDTLGRVSTSTVDPGGLNRTTSYTYDADSNVLSTKLTGGGQTRETDSTYDALGDTLTSTVVNTPANAITSYTYNQLGENTALTTPDGNVAGANAADYTTTFSYDALGQQIQSIAPPVTTTTFNTGTGQPSTITASAISLTGYNTFGEPAESEDPDGNITTVTRTFDAAGEHQAVAQNAYTAPGSSTPVTSVTQTDYDAMGRVRTITVDPNGLDRVTTSTYDQLGNLVEQDLPALGGTVPKQTYSVDLDGEVLSSTDPTGAVTESTYDDLGRQATESQIVRQTDHSSTTAPAAIYTGSYTYDDAGNRTSVISPDGATGTATYDAAGEVLTSTNAVGAVTHYQYDLTGSPTEITEPGTDATHPGTSQNTSYDQAEQAVGTSTLDPHGTTVASTSVSYDADGNVLSTTDADKNTSTATYNALDEIIQQVQPTDATHHITTAYGYDSDGQQTAYTDGNQNTTYTTYNTLGLPESVIDPATAAYPNLADRTYTTAYDTAGEAVTKAEPGGVTQTSTYNAFGELTGQSGTGAEAVTASRTLGYDADGRLTSATTPTSTSTYSYEDRGHLWTSSGSTGSASFTYNSNDELTSRTDATGTTNYTYDKAGQVSTLADPQTGTTLQYSYYLTGDLQSVNYGTGGPSQTFVYDAQDNLTANTVKTSTGSTMASLSYGYTAAGHISSQTSTGIAGAASSSYTYDKAGRLTSWSNGTTNTGYTYDGNGNLTGRGSTTATYNARNQLTATGNTSYNYTARGTLASTTIGGTATMTSTYDAYDQLATQGAQNYTYDALGRLATTNGHSLSYDDTSDSITSDGTQSYTRTPNGALVSIGSGGSSAFAYTDTHDDLIGSFTTTGTALSSSTSYDPWGRPVASTGTTNDLGYQGGWTDPATGQVNTASRWYNPGTADFTSRDAAVLNPATSSSGNLYAYANENPLSNADPSGNSACYPTPTWTPSNPEDPNNPQSPSFDPNIDWDVATAFPYGNGAVRDSAGYSWAYDSSTAYLDSLSTMSGGGYYGMDNWEWMSVGGLGGYGLLGSLIEVSPFVLAAGSSSCASSHIPKPKPPIDWVKQKPRPCSSSRDNCKTIGQVGNLNGLENGATNQGSPGINPTQDPTASFTAAQLRLAMAEIGNGDPGSTQIDSSDCALPQDERTIYQPLDSGRSTGVFALICPDDLKGPNAGRDDGGKVSVQGFPEIDRNRTPGKPSVVMYNRTHIFADRFGGKWISENLFPGYAKMNLSGMKRCENSMARQLRAGVPVLYSGQVDNSDGKRPKGIQMTAFTPAGELFDVYVKNIAILQRTC